MRRIIDIVEYLPEWLRHFAEGIIIFVFFGIVSNLLHPVMVGLIACLLIALRTEIRDYIEHVTKPHCHPEGFDLKDFGFRIFPVIMFFVAWIINLIVF